MRQKIGDDEEWAGDAGRNRPHEGPLVSVLIAAYNHEKYIEQAVQSVFSQTYKNIELIIVDDFSTDRTRDGILAQTLSTPAGFRLVYLQNDKNYGVSKTSNIALSRARGEWIAALASDDYYHPRYIEEMLAVGMSITEHQAVIHCDAVEIDTRGNIVGTIYSKTSLSPASGDCFWDIIEGRCKIVSGTIFARRKLYQLVGGHDETLRSEDFDLHLKFSREAEFFFIPKTLYYARTVPGSLGRRTRSWADDVFKVLSKYSFLDERRIGFIADKKKALLMKRLAFEGDVKLSRQFLSKIREPNKHTTDNLIYLSFLYVEFIYFISIGILFRMGVRRPRWWRKLGYRKN